MLILRPPFASISGSKLRNIDSEFERCFSSDSLHFEGSLLTVPIGDIELGDATQDPPPPPLYAKTGVPLAVMDMCPPWC